jgi:2-amino-4-hydroxy-6-hydroxymethyldihydropteridine diphosphokinase
MVKSHWYPAYIGLGSNLQMPTRQVKAAIDLVGDVPKTQVVTVSPLYRSAPFGGVEQPDFVNAVAALLTQLSPSELLAELKNIEMRQGRERNDKRWGPRVIDLDLLIYASAVIERPDVTVPHPGVGERNFVLLPLLDIAPDLVVPGLGRVAAIPVNDEPSISRIP